MDGDMTKAIWLYHQVALTFQVAAIHQLLEYWCNFSASGMAYGLLLLLKYFSCCPRRMKMPRAHCRARLGRGRLLVILVRKRFTAADA
jgi:hypothetical protein